MKCPKCQNEVFEGEKFCRMCGNRLITAPAPQPQQPVAQPIAPQPPVAPQQPQYQQPQPQPVQYQQPQVQPTQYQQSRVQPNPYGQQYPQMGYAQQPQYQQPKPQVAPQQPQYQQPQPQVAPQQPQYQQPQPAQYQQPQVQANPYGQQYPQPGYAQQPQYQQPQQMQYQQPQLQQAPMTGYSPVAARPRKKKAASIFALLLVFGAFIFQFMLMGLPTESMWASAASIHSACEAWIWFFWISTGLLAIAWILIIVTLAKKNRTAVTVVAIVLASLSLALTVLCAIHYSDISDKYKKTDVNYYKNQIEDLID